MGGRRPDRALQQTALGQDNQNFTSLRAQFPKRMRVLHLSVFTPVENTHPATSALKSHLFPTPSPCAHLSLASSALPLKGLKPALGDAGLHGEVWPDRPREALRLRLLSKPRFLLPPSRLTRLRSLRPAGGGRPSSSPSSCCSVDWGKSRPLQEVVHVNGSIMPASAFRTRHANE